MNDDNEKTQTDDVDSANKFNGLDFRKMKCFGLSSKTNTSWVDIIQLSINNGWKTIDINKLELMLKNDVELHYHNIVTLEFLDVNSNMSWVVKFINDKSLWELSIKNSPNAEVLDEDRTDFFNCEEFKKYSLIAGDILINANKKFNLILKSKFEEGEFIEVDEIKLSAILFWLNDDKHFMENLRTGVFMNRNSSY